MLCDLDNVIRFYDLASLAEFERALGLPAGTTAGVAYAPEVDLPLLLGKIAKEERVDPIALALSDQVPRTGVRELALTLADAPFRADGKEWPCEPRAGTHTPRPGDQRAPGTGA